jgi:hypothetical protein
MSVAWQSRARAFFERVATKPVERPLRDAAAILQKWRRYVLAT